MRSLLPPTCPTSSLFPPSTLRIRLLHVGMLLTALTMAACGAGSSQRDGGGGGDEDSGGDGGDHGTPPGPTTLAVTALSVTPTSGPWDTTLQLSYTFTVTNGSATTSTEKTLYAGVATTTTLPVHWFREGSVTPGVEAWGGTSADVPALAPGESVTVTSTGGVSGQGEAWSVVGYLDACLFTEGIEELTGCNSTPVTLTQVDPTSIPASLPTVVPGYGGEFPHTAAALDATPTRAASALMGASFGWDRPGPFSWSPTRTDDQSWGFDAASGINVGITMPWGTFIESLDFTATVVTLEPADVSRPLPFGTVMAAFDSAPADLGTEQPFTLRFTLSETALAGVSAEELVVFGADSDGTNLRLLPLIANAGGGFSAGTLTVALRHFGIVGLAAMSPAQRDALAVSWPRDIDAQMESALGAASVARRLTALANPGLVQAALVFQALEADPLAQVVNRSMAYYNDVIVPTFAAAYGGDEPELEAAARVGLGWLRQLALLGLDEGEPLGPLAADLWTRINDLMDRHADKVKEKCLAGGGFGAFQRMLGDMRQLQLLGHDAKAQELAEALGACSSFRVDYHQAWSDENTNAALVAGVEGTVMLTAPTANMIKVGSLPRGDGNLEWTTFQSSTTDTQTTYDNEGHVIGSCSTTTIGTGTTGSQFTIYVKDYGLSFLKGGGHKPLTALLWPYGTYNGTTHIPMGIRYSSTSTCDGVQPRTWDASATPEINDPDLVNRGDGMRVFSAPWSGGNYVHTWSINRGEGLHPTREQLTITIHTQ